MTPTLADLPAPPEGRTGWPWTEASPMLPPTRPDGSPWPRITIATPSYNQGRYIEETIRSILLQGYPNLEYIVMDGGSTDGAVDVIRKYAPWIDYWESVPDRGQAHAINKGLARATGEIFQFINSDDLLSQRVLATVALAWNGCCVAGTVRYFGTAEGLTENRGLLARLLLNEAYDKSNCTFHQPGIWLATSNLRHLGEFEISLRYSFDAEMFIRYFAKFPDVAYSPEILALFRVHDRSKSESEAAGFIKEYSEARRLVARKLEDPTLRKLAISVAHKYAWHREVTKVVTTSNRFKAASKLLVGMISIPQHRIDRFTLGALRDSVFGRRRG